MIVFLLTLTCNWQLFAGESSLKSRQTEQWVVPEGFKVEAVVTDLFLPVNIAFVPNPLPEAGAPLYYITELYGQVKVVLQNGEVRTYAENLLNFEPTGDFPGSGELGVSGIVVEPLSGDLFVTMVYEDDGIKNRVVRMSSIDGGRSMNTLTILLDGIPGPVQSHQIHQATIGPDNKLYVQVGDGFFDTAAQSDTDLRGKILRMNFDGSIPADNPAPGSYVYAKGVRNPFGGAWRAADNRLYISGNGPERDDRLVKVEAGGNHGWPNSLLPGAIHIWNPTVAPTAVAFCNGSGFPETLQGLLFVGLSGPTYHPGITSRGKRIEMFGLNENGQVISREIFMNYNGGGRATVVGVAFGPDGLYFTDLYGEEGFDFNGQTQANVYRVYYDPPTAIEPNNSLPAGFALAQNYPNPFNPQTTITYMLPQREHVTLTIYNMEGRKLKTLINKPLPGGTHQVTVDGAGISSGVYIYRITAGVFKAVRKMVLIR